MIEHSSPVSWRKRHKHSNGRRTTSPVLPRAQIATTQAEYNLGQLHAELGRAPINPVRDQPNSMSASLRRRPNYCAATNDAMCHVWTAPSWQGFSSRLQAGRCSHVFGLLARHTRPLAIMPSADQVPVKSPHSRMQWHMWVVLIAGSSGSALRAVRPPNLHITPGSRRDLVHAASVTGSL
jgi:hypothetical protein